MARYSKRSEKEQGGSTTIRINVVDGVTFFQNLITNPPKLDRKGAGKMLRYLEEKVRQTTGMSLEEYLKRSLEEERDPKEKAFTKMVLKMYQSLSEYLDFIRKYADPDEIENITVGSDLFFKKMLNKEFTILDVLRQDLGVCGTWVYAIIDVDGERYLFSDPEHIYFITTTGEKGKSLGLQLTNILKEYKLPLKATVVRKGQYFKWVIR